MNKALDEVRARESRRMASEGRTPLLKKSRWLLLEREENLKEEQRFRLAAAATERSSSWARCGNASFADTTRPVTCLPQAGEL
jgi:hypothetical protein